MFFWNSLAFCMIQQMLAIWSLVLLPFPKPAWTSESSQFTYCWSLAWRILSITLQACESEVTQSCPTLCDPMDYSLPAPLSMGFSRQEFWKRLPFPSPGYLPSPGIKPGSPALRADALPSEPPGKPCSPKGLTKIFSNATDQRHQFFGAQPFLRSNFHICMWLLQKP